MCVLQCIHVLILKVAGLVFVDPLIYELLFYFQTYTLTLPHKQNQRHPCLPSLSADTHTESDSN